ncbi:MAG: two-component sensor histidine kinase [Herpetosiphonaceae bacterium]|nr:MAG: two-component sensor histidine kinase [Herpetosiphonaceae bacterium]
MVHSLRSRLLLTLIVVVTVAVGSVAIFASRATSSQFERYVKRNVECYRRCLAELAVYYIDNRSWDGVQPLVDQLAQLYGERLMVYDTRGHLVADSGGSSGRWLDQRPPTSFPVFISYKGAPVGVLYVDPLGEADIGSREAGFIGAVNRSILLAVAVAGLVVLAATLALSRRILGPVERLTAVARRMEKGDLSQRVDVRARDEIGELARAFNAMADGLARLEQLRRNMVSDVAHELRTPLSNIRGYLEALRDGVVQPTPELIESLHEEALLLSRLIDDLQELALAEAGQLRLVRQQLALPDIVEQAVQSLRPRAAAGDLRLIVDLPSDLPAVDGDPERIGQVLRNLLNNALTYTQPGGEIHVYARSAGQEVEVFVRDTGIGISPDDLPFVFERFYRADRSRARATGGAGLGLAIVKELVEAHGGRVWAESTPGAGSIFAFTLPIWLGASSHERERRASHPPEHSASSALPFTG